MEAFEAAKKNKFKRSRGDAPDASASERERRKQIKREKRANREKKDKSAKKNKRSVGSVVDSGQADHHGSASALSQGKSPKVAQGMVKEGEVPAPTPQAGPAKGRKYTVSIALPGSIVSNAQSPQLRSYLVGQIARALAVFNVDEVIVFREDTTGQKSTTGVRDGGSGHSRDGPMDPCMYMARLLQYLDCPQYLRKAFFPMHRDLQHAGLLNPVAAPHHMGKEALSHYREGVTLARPTKQGQGCFVDCGLWKEVQIDKALQAGCRVTVKLDPLQQSNTKLKRFEGIAVSPAEPREQEGTYWGYSVRVADTLTQIFTQCPYKGGYDVTVGTSERGQPVEEFEVPAFDHMLVVFGGLHGLEASVEADQALGVTDPSVLFDSYLNTCQSQGSNTIRTEEAILITMSALRPQICTVGRK